MPDVFWKPLPGGVQPFKLSRTTLVTPHPISCFFPVLSSPLTAWVPDSCPASPTPTQSNSQGEWVYLRDILFKCFNPVALVRWWCGCQSLLGDVSFPTDFSCPLIPRSLGPCTSTHQFTRASQLRCWKSFPCLRCEWLWPHWRVQGISMAEKLGRTSPMGVDNSVSRCTALWKLNLPISQKHLDPPSVVLAGPPKLASDCPEVICQGSQLLHESKASFPEACAKLGFCAVFWGSCVHVPSGWAGSTYNSWGSRERVSSQRGVRGLRQIVIGVLWEGLNLNENWVPYLHQILMTSNICQEVNGINSILHMVSFSSCENSRRSFC